MRADRRDKLQLTLLYCLHLVQTGCCSRLYACCFETILGFEQFAPVRPFAAVRAFAFAACCIKQSRSELCEHLSYRS